MKKKIIIALVVIVGMLVGLMFIPVDDERVAYNVMSMNMAYEHFKTTEERVILDVRTESEFNEGHIPGAINLSVDLIDDDVTDVLPNFDIPIYVYCRSGNRSVTASKKLVKLGYKSVTEFGGIRDWPGGIAK